MQNVWFKSRTRDVCGCFVVAVSFAEGNVRANGACDRVVRVVRCRGNSVAGAAYAAVRSHALAHIRHATLLYVLMHLHTYVMLRRCTFSCTCTHTSCYAAVRFHALAHIRHATPLYVLTHLHTYVMLRCCTFSCTCTHTSCYAAVRSHALAHIRHATPLYVLMHLHTYNMLRRCTFSCTCTHTSCYAAVRSHALPDRRAGVRWIVMDM